MSQPLSFETHPDGSLVLNLQDACIQTTARRAQREITRRLLSDKPSDNTLDTFFDLLQHFLAATDFARLRTDHPELIGHPPCRVRLFRGGDESVRWEVITET